MENDQRGEQLVILLKALAARAKVSQALVAELLRVSQPTVSLWYSGKAYPTRRVHIRMLEAGCRLLGKALKEGKLPVRKDLYRTRTERIQAAKHALGFRHPLEELDEVSGLDEAEA